jgi:hypothetical protein
MRRFLSKTFLSALLFFCQVTAAWAVSKPSEQETLSMLRQLRGDAIELGSGPVDVYVFIDPNCPHSHDFLEMVVDSDKMQRRYHYYFFLYALPIFRSSGIINAIYAAPSPREAMLGYMLAHRHLAKLSRMTPPAVDARVTRISNTAEAIGVDKRPYLIIDRKKRP